MIVSLKIFFHIYQQAFVEVSRCLAVRRSRSTTAHAKNGRCSWPKRFWPGAPPMLAQGSPSFQHDESSENLKRNEKHPLVYQQIYYLFFFCLAPRSKTRSVVGQRSPAECENKGRTRTPTDSTRRERELSGRSVIM